MSVSASHSSSPASERCRSVSFTYCACDVRPVALLPLCCITSLFSSLPPYSPWHFSVEAVFSRGYPAAISALIFVYMLSYVTIESATFPSDSVVNWSQECVGAPFYLFISLFKFCHQEQLWICGMIFQD